MMLDLERFRSLARSSLQEKDPAKLRKLLDEMLLLLRAEQRIMKQEVEERISRYPGPPIQPGPLPEPWASK